jgi:GNAT superfamily N-acetyltransferase
VSKPLAGQPSAPPLFPVCGHQVRLLAANDIAGLQAFFVANPAYFLAVHGEPARPDEAQQEWEDRPPAGMAYGRQDLLGCFDSAGELVAMASVTAGMVDPQVWHLGLFIVATHLHGQGLAPAFYAGLEAWVQRLGALWLRLGVVKGHARAERFWLRQGFVQVRERGPVQMGRLTQTLRVMVKPLGDLGLQPYLDRVARDRHEVADSPPRGLSQRPLQ